MSKESDQGTIKGNPKIVITNKVISFWSQIIQISNICDIGKYIELKRQKYSPWMIWLSLFAGVALYIFATATKYANQTVCLMILLGLPIGMSILYWWEQRSPKKYCFRIRMSGGQEHYIFSNNESFVNKLIEATIAAMEDSTKSITFIGNIDNSTVVKDSNIAIDSTVKGSFNS
jgi:hypothetical protein